MGGLVVTFGIGTYYNFGATIVVQASANTKTISSYWGPPSLTLKTISTLINPESVDTLQVSNVSMVETAPKFIPGTFAYALSVYIGSDSSINYADYSAGAKSYPNGTVILSQALPSLSNVNITFRYVYNNVVLQALKISQATLIMNYHGDFIYTSNFYTRIKTTYLFQLLDYWAIQYYLDVYNGLDFPHVFNFLDSVPICYTTIDWVHTQQQQGFCQKFMGISLDFEPGNKPVPTGDPGGRPLWPGILINDSEYLKSWYGLNEQNQTLFDQATFAYEHVYSYGSSFGYKSYLIFGRGELADLIDGDIDYTRLPIFPISLNPDVRFGIMSYQDANIHGDWYQYRDCKEQIQLFGDRGKSILTGWIANGTRYYTDDQIGLERYIEHCLVAQAAGMTEIFHAPIYRLQAKWGDDAILRLHQELNENPKRTFTIYVPSYKLNQDYMNDYIGNFNNIWVFLLIYAFILTIVIWHPLKTHLKFLSAQDQRK
jgi:hypothetical protein